MKPIFLQRLAFALSCLICLTGVSCNKNRKISVYQVEREPMVEAPAAENPHGVTLPPVEVPGQEQQPADAHALMAVVKAPVVSDQAPTHWQKKPSTAMRMASYQVAGDGGAEADVSFTTLRSAPGSLAANLNRWREQVGLEPLEEEPLKKDCQVVPTAFGDALLIDVASPSPATTPLKDGRILGAIAEKDGLAWFFKMRGNVELLGREKPAFIAWMATVKAMEAQQPQSPPAAASEERKLDWQLPDGWSARLGGASRYATLDIPDGRGGSTALVVSFFPGDVGGDLANVNRWRGQVGLEPIDEASAKSTIQTVTAGSDTYQTIDLQGSKTRLLAAWIRHGEHTWFFKWTGAQEQLDAVQFRNFVSSLRFVADPS